ncbi:hypothetical protein D3C78_1089970 [compost metagenome]
MTGHGALLLNDVARNGAVEAIQVGDRYGLAIGGFLDGVAVFQEDALQAASSVFEHVSHLPHGDRVYPCCWGILPPPIERRYGRQNSCG